MEPLNTPKHDTKTVISKFGPQSKYKQGTLEIDAISSNKHKLKNLT